MLSTGDSSIDILIANDEMVTTIKDTGWAVDLREEVLTEEVLPQFNQTYIQDKITAKDGAIVALPSYKGAFALWVNQKILDLTGMDAIEDQEDFEKFCALCKEQGIYGYGGAWEKTYVFNELDQKFIDGKYGMMFNWGTGSDFEKAGMLREDAIHMIDTPLFEKKTVLADSWCYVLNAASEHQEAAIRFLQWAASPEGEVYEYECFGRYPARKDVETELIDERDMVRRMYANYDENYEVRGRDMMPQAMDHISTIGTLFQQYVFGVITAEDFCASAQKAVDANR